MVIPEGFLTILTTQDSPVSTVPESLRRRFVRWWLHDYPPLDGRLRLLVYGGLLALALFNERSPLQGILSYGLTDPALFRTFGLINWLRVPHLPFSLVAAVVVVTAIAWAATAIGLLTRATAIVTAVGVFVLHGYFWGTSTFSHNWYLAIYVLAALAFAGVDPAWSADGWLARRRGRQAPTREGIGATGFPRKLALVCVVSFYFLAGVTKLQTAGLEWADGHTIAYWGSQRGEEFARPLGLTLGKYPAFCQALSIGTLVFETGAPLVLLFPRLLWVFIPGWIVMHFGIRLAMGPPYYENMICFLVIVYWHLLREENPQAVLSPGEPRPPGSGEHAAVALGVAAILTTATVAVMQINWWPFTNVYMYSAYYSAERAIRAGDPIHEYVTAAGVQRIAARFRDNPPSFDAMEHLPLRARLWLTGATGERNQLFALGVATPKQWDIVIELPVLIEDLASKPPGNIAYDPAAGQTAANRFLETLVPVVYRQVPEWGRFERLELTYSLEKEGRVVIASVPLHAGVRLGRGR